jgi:8-oxo-dGTP pyrophosphatase MutT (NUDIX family)
MNTESAPLHQQDQNPMLQLIEYLEAYKLINAKESDTTNQFLRFIASHQDAFMRSCAPGHITGSALVVDPSMTMTLLVHHRKLEKWLQPGGHIEAGETALQAAMREAFEETGVPAIPYAPGQIFDIDIHAIPDRPDTPAHYHYDVRFLLVAQPGQTTVSHESHAVEWVRFDEALRRNPEESIVRMLAKASALSLAKASALSLS